MKIISKEPELTFKDVLLLPGKSNFTIDQDLEKTNIKTKISKNLEIDIPICSAPMPHLTEEEMAIAIAKAGGIGFIHCFQTFEKQIEQVKVVKKEHLKVAVSVYDFSKKGLDHIGELIKNKVDLICVETAQAHNKQTIDFIKEIKNKYPKSEICAALVVTGDATEELIKAGADSIRVGIGGGSHCTTRLKTGIGRPQLSALLECYEVAKKYNVPIISDTGIEYPGDIAKALAFGADAVMIGGVFTGTTESPGKIIKKKNKYYKFSAGMCSNMTTHGKTGVNIKNTIKKYISIFKMSIKEKIKNKNIFIPTYSQAFQDLKEGVYGNIEYKGSVIPIIQEYKNGLIRSMWYLGAKNIKEIKDNTKVVITTQNTIKDNLPRI